MWATNGVRLTIQIRLTGISLLHGELHADVGSLCSKQQCCNERFASRGNRRYSSIMLPGIYICPSHYARAIIGHIYMPSAVGGLRRVRHVILHTARQPRTFTDNELHLLASFHGISSPANNCRSYLYERARLEIKCNFFKLILSSYDVPVASYT